MVGEGEGLTPGSVEGTVPKVMTLHGRGWHGGGCEERGPGGEGPEEPR